jgi:hypothetical protein
MRCDDHTQHGEGAHDKTTLEPYRPESGRRGRRAALPGVRDHRGAMQGHDPRAWDVVEVVLGAVDAHLNGIDDPPRSVEKPGPALDYDTAHAAVTRSLPVSTSFDALVAHERSTGAELALRDAFEEMDTWRREAEESRRGIGTVHQLLRPLGSKPLNARPPVEREAVAWLIDWVEAALGPGRSLLKDALAAQRDRASLTAAELPTAPGLARLEWLARLNAALSLGMVE